MTRFIPTTIDEMRFVIAALRAEDPVGLVSATIRAARGQNRVGERPFLARLEGLPRVPARVSYLMT
jgi:hypothetical protein